MADAKDLRAFIDETLTAWDVPGASVALLRDGDAVLCDGFGMRDREAGLAVTADTLFPIASASKSFTALSVGMLVDEGRLAWDTPVREFLPSFRLHDPVLTERVTPRDLLCHRTGLPRHDMTWYASRVTRPELMARLRHLEKSADLRAKFQYNNLLFMAAGFLAGETAGTTWEGFVRERIFAPLGMTRSNHSTVVTGHDPDRAQGYKELHDELRPIPYFEMEAEKDAVGPAGNICSTANDLARYVRMHLGRGEVDGVRIASAPVIAETHRAQMLAPAGPPPFQALGLGFDSYGLGWFVNAWKGRRLVHHGGNINGFSTLVALLPDLGIGAAILTNRDGNPIPMLLALGLFERLLGDTPLTDGTALVKPFYDEMKAAEKRRKGKSEEDRVPGAAPSRPLSAYVGDYEHPSYGVVTVEAADATGPDKGGLTLTFNDKLACDLSPYHYDVFEAHYVPLDARMKARFEGDVQGRLTSVAISLEPAVADIVFTRLPDRALRDTSRFGDYAGTYEGFTGPISVSRRADGSLAVTFPNDEPRALTPYRADGDTLEFAVAGRNGLLLAFARDAEGGAVSALTVTTPGGVFAAKRRV